MTTDPADDDRSPIPGSAAWWLARENSTRQVRHRADGITLRRILDAALLVVQEEGADALTMRRVAERLDTGAASLYRHIASRDELVVLLVDDIIQLPKTAPPTTSDWKQRLERVARNLRAHLLRHREVIPLITAAQMIGPSSMRGREALLRHLTESGFDPTTAIRIHMTITHFTVATAQLDWRQGARTAPERAELRALFKAQSAHGFPLVADHADLFAAHDSDAEFEFGLTALIHGFEHLRNRDEDLNQ